jgi:hypothetical protein
MQPATLTLLPPTLFANSPDLKQSTQEASNEDEVEYDNGLTYTDTKMDRKFSTKKSEAAIHAGDRLYETFDCKNTL